MEFAPKASINIDRSSHPDIDPTTGELYGEVDLIPDPVQRQRRYDWDHKDGYRPNWEARLEGYQRTLPVRVQQYVQGKTYNSAEEYQAAVQVAMQAEGVQRGAQVLLTDVDIERMDLAEYDYYFDANGRPKLGVQVHLQRGQVLDDGRPG